MGSGPAGTRASETVRKRDRGARIVVVSSDPYPFYNRILLSKDFLKRDDLAPGQVVIKPVEIYERQGIELRRGHAVVRVDAREQEVFLDSGVILRYGRCLVASGATPIRPPFPGVDAPGVHTLRSLSDAVRIRDAAREAAHAVVIGGGLIGVEVATALTERGIDCTVIERERWLFGLAAPEPVGLALERILVDGGVTVVTNATVIGIERDREGLVVRARPMGRSTQRGETDAGPADAAEAVEAAAHDRTLPADVVVIGVGVRPNTDFVGDVERTGDGGIVVDECLRATPGLWAAGDVAVYPDPIAGFPQRIEHWLHAQHQGRLAGANMSGGEDRYAELSSYDTDLFGTPVQVFGAPGVAEAWSDDVLSGNGVAWGFQRGRAVTAYRIGAPEVTAADIERRIKGSWKSRRRAGEPTTPPTGARRSPGSPDRGSPGPARH